LIFSTAPQVIPYKLGTCEKDIGETLDEYCDQRYEGVLIKSATSAYVPGQRKTNWVKVKPEYVTGMYDELDTVILGNSTLALLFGLSSHSPNHFD
jgi:ATP-dependent DNA ligase